MEKNPTDLKLKAKLAASDALAIYIKLLYSKNFYNQNKLDLKNNPAKFNNFFNGININDLEFEQYARIRNLKSFLLKNDLIKTITSSLDQDKLIEEYCNWEYFFCFKGRCLTEDFCLFLYSYFLKLNNFKCAEAVKVQGIISGININTSSPWGSECFKKDKSIHEIFKSTFEIKLHNNEIKISDIHINTKITISANSSGQIKIFTQEIL